MAKRILTLMLLLLVVPLLTVKAESQTITSEEEFKSALANEEIDTIILGSNIETTSKINITRPIYLDGKGHTITYTGTFDSQGSKDKTVWGGIYVLQVYRTTATIKDIKLTGGNAALLINGGNVTFEGTIDVSGNGFGGIEIGQGKGVTETGKLALKDDAQIENSTDSNNAPTLWVPEDTPKGVLEINGESKTITAGEELEISEIEELFDINNPSTNDSLNLNLISASLGLLSFISFFTYFKQTKKNF